MPCIFPNVHRQVCKETCASYSYYGTQNADEVRLQRLRTVAREWHVSGSANAAHDVHPPFMGHLLGFWFSFRGRFFFFFCGRVVPACVFCAYPFSLLRTSVPFRMCWSCSCTYCTPVSTHHVKRPLRAATILKHLCTGAGRNEPHFLPPPSLRSSFPPLKNPEQCWCSNSGNYAQYEEVDCETGKECSGDSDEICGGFDMVSVYRNGGGSRTSAC